MCAKFEVTRDMTGSQNLKVSHIIPPTPPSDTFYTLYLWPLAYICYKI